MGALPIVPAVYRSGNTSSLLPSWIPSKGHVRLESGLTMEQLRTSSSVRWCRRGANVRASLDKIKGVSSVFVDRNRIMIASKLINIMYACIIREVQWVF